MFKRTLLIATALLLFSVSPALAEPAPNMPNNPIHGTDIKLFNGLFAEQASNYVRDARDAIDHCDRRKFKNTMRKIKALNRDARNRHLNDDDAAKMVNALFVPGVLDFDGVDRDNLNAVATMLTNEWEAKQPCLSQGQKTYFNALMHFNLNLMAGIVNSITGTSFLGTETAGGGSRQLGVVKPAEQGDRDGVKAELRVPLSRMPNFMEQLASHLVLWDLFFTMSHIQSNFVSRIDTLDPGPGRLLLPGVGAGPNPAGFVSAAPNNIVTDMLYDTEFNQQAYGFGFGRTFTLKNSRTKIRPFGGLEIEEIDSIERFGGNIPSLARQFYYETRVTNDVVSPFIGVEAEFRPSWTVPGYNLPIEFGINARYAHNFNDADGTDMLLLTGFVPGSIDISDDQDTSNIQAGFNVTINPDAPWSLSFGGQYERIGNVPVIMRDGGNPSQLDFEEADSFMGVIRTTFRF